MQNDDTPEESTNRRSVLKAIGAGALATTALVGAGSADHVESTDGGIGEANCVNEWTEYRCVDSGCDCDDPCTSCECDTKRQSRDCCEDTIGHILCGPWTDTGDCCSSC